MDSVIYCGVRKSFGIYFSTECINNTKILRYLKYEIHCCLIPGDGDYQRNMYKGTNTGVLISL